jgi:hypothetical protein
MAFQVLELSIELVDALTPLMPRIKQRDKALADQLSRAASSIALNCGEAEYSDPGNKRARLFSAAGSAGDRAVAEDFGDSLEDDSGVTVRAQRRRFKSRGRYPAWATEICVGIEVRVA